METNLEMSVGMEIFWKIENQNLDLLKSIEIAKKRTYIPKEARDCFPQCSIKSYSFLKEKVANQHICLIVGDIFQCWLEMSKEPKVYFGKWIWKIVFQNNT